jgi:hypothetical protein
MWNIWDEKEQNGVLFYLMMIHLIQADTECGVHLLTDKLDGLLIQ